MLQLLKGKKTYISAALLALFALYGWAKGVFTADQAMVYLAQAAATAGLRNAAS